MASDYYVTFWILPRTGRLMKLYDGVGVAFWFGEDFQVGYKVRRVG